VTGDRSGADDGAVVEAFAIGTTSGLTAVERARAGTTSAVRVGIVAGRGTAIASIVHTIGYLAAASDVNDDAVMTMIDDVQPHAILIDVTVSAAGEVLRRLMDEQKFVPVIAIDAANTSERAADRWLAAGADDYLSAEQLTPAIVRRAIEAAIARGRARDLRQRVSEADRLSAIATLAAGVAHEVNNPASYVLMNLQTCRQHLADLRRELVDDSAGDGTPNRLAPTFDEMTEMLDDNTRGIERIVAIVQSLRAFARPEPDHNQPVDLAAVCRDVNELLGSQLRHRARVRLDVQPVPTIEADSRKLAQIVINLMVNAAESIPAGEPGHEITVALRTRDDRIVLSVADTGRSLAVGRHSRIFEPFGAARSQSGSHGLGLATVRMLVERLGGKISVAAQRRAGTEFVVSLPINRPEPRRRVATGPVPDASRARLLVVDDEIALTSAMRRQLRGHHDVTVINDGAAALTLIMHQSFDAILCDVMMPGTDGLALLESLRSTRPEMASRVVLFTAGVFSDSMRERVIELGAMLLDKPAPLNTLLTVIEGIRRRTRD
jgi:signal transduction histidine kinase